MTLFHNRNFRLLFAADVLSGFGDRLSVFALFLLIYQMTGRALDMGILMIVQAVPAILIGPLAGVYIDRAHKKRVLIGAALVQGFLVLLIPFTSTVWQVYLIAAAQALTRQVFSPARLAILPELVAQEDIPRANALNTISLNILLIAGPAAGGVIVGFFGTSPAFFIDAATFLLGAAILMGLAAQRAETSSSVKRDFLEEFKEGIRYIRHTPLMRSLVPMLALLVFVGSMQSPLIVVFVKEILLRGDVELGILMSAVGLGGILGGVSTAVLGRRVGGLGAISWFFIIEGVLLALFAVNRSYSLGLLIFVIFGTLGAALHIILMSLFQTHIPEEKRGRVFANLTPILGPLSIASIGLGTLLADRAGVMVVLIAAGAMEVAGGLYGVLRRISGIRRGDSSGGTPRERPTSSR
ncbi:MAG: MFS transporter [Candidatus Latescibacterota bacterium]